MGLTGNIYFGLQGNDTFNHSFNGQFLVYVGGSGNDTYNMDVNSGLMSIAEAGGALDTVIARGLGISRSTTHFATIDSRHLYAFDTASGQGVVLLDWTVPAHRIENIILSDGNYSYSQIVQAMNVSLNGLGNYSWDGAVQAGLLGLPPGTFGVDVQEALVFYKARALALEAPIFSITNTATNQASTQAASLYSGPVSYLDLQFIGTNNPEAVAGSAFSDFFNALGGDDAISAGLGDDVIDGGMGSNFLSGGAGWDVFFLDGRGGGPTWGTITDWEAGEQLSLFGWRPGVSRSIYLDSAGTPGYTGVTFHADLDGNGSIDASVTWAGVSRSQLPAPSEFDGLLWFK
jgi:Ca2+-binding RTX toxin-like protein